MTPISTPKEKKPVILIADNDINWGRFLLTYLENKGFDTHWQTDGLTAWQQLEQTRIDFCILSPSLPHSDGLKLAHRIRNRFKYLPIMFIAQPAHDAETTRIACFKAGADDFIALPCALEEILLRIKTIRKRFRFCPIEEDKTVFDLGLLNFDYNEQKLFSPNRQLHLTTKESELLKTLCLHRNKVLERDQALLAVWKSTAIYNVRSMDVYISKLRRLLFQYTYSEILNIHGVGFKLITHRDASFRDITPRDKRTIRYRQTLKREALGADSVLSEVPATETVTVAAEATVTAGAAEEKAVAAVTVAAAATTAATEATTAAATEATPATAVTEVTAAGETNVEDATDTAAEAAAGATEAAGLTVQATGLAAGIISVAAEMEAGQITIAAESAIVEGIGMTSKTSPTRDAAPPDGHTTPGRHTP